MDKHSVPNFVQCSGFHLPFRDGAFNQVVCFGMIEHVDKPFRLFRELARVCNGQLEVSYPNRFGDQFWSIINRRCFGWNRRHHVSVFNQAWFNVACRVLGFRPPVFSVDTWWTFPHEFLPWLKVPSMMKLTAKRRGVN